MLVHTKQIGSMQKWMRCDSNSMAGGGERNEENRRDGRKNENKQTYCSIKICKMENK